MEGFNFLGSKQKKLDLLLKAKKLTGNAGSFSAAQYGGASNQKRAQQNERPGFMERVKALHVAGDRSMEFKRSREHTPSKNKKEENGDRKICKFFHYGSHPVEVVYYCLPETQRAAPGSCQATRC